MFCEVKTGLNRILVTGSVGQIGTELVHTLREKYGRDSVIACGHMTKPTSEFRRSGPFRYLNVTDQEQIAKMVVDEDIDTIFHMASILSAVGELNPQLCYRINMDGLYNVLEIARRHRIEKVITASSIAVFGAGAPNVKTPNDTIMLPRTMYGITKVAGELLSEYYFNKYQVDVRSLRFPGIISHQTVPGGGTTDYSVEMYYAAVEGKPYVCFVREDTILPMMYMPDAIGGLIDLAESDGSRLKHRVFNVNSMSFSASQLADSIRRFVPSFSCVYRPDYRQSIADSWPTSLDDSAAREEWNWNPRFDLDRMTEDMIEELRKKRSSIQG